MKPGALIRNLVKHQFEFDIGWWDWRNNGTWISGGCEYYCIHIILGNCEYVIPLNDHDRLATLWEEIQNYYIY